MPKKNAEETKTPKAVSEKKTQSQKETKKVEPDISPKEKARLERKKQHLAEHKAEAEKLKAEREKAEKERKAQYPFIGCEYENAKIIDVIGEKDTAYHCKMTDGTTKYIPKDVLGKLTK